jgi:two-component system chemotaxis response regulator CheY
MARFLIVDDSSTIRAILRDNLAAIGHSVAGEAAGGREAVRLFSELAPDFVLMDIAIEDIDGFEAIRRIRAFAPEARVIVITALPREQIDADLRALRVTGYLAKPFTQENLRLTLAAADG